MLCVRICGISFIGFLTPHNFNQLDFFCGGRIAFTIIRALNCGSPSGRFYLTSRWDIAFLAEYNLISDANGDGGCIEFEDFLFETKRAISSSPILIQHQKLLPVYFLLSTVIGFARHSSRIKWLSRARDLYRLYSFPCLTITMLFPKIRIINQCKCISRGVLGIYQEYRIYHVIMWIMQSEMTEMKVH